MKFKVGDKVRVRKDLEEYRMYGNQEFVTSMKGYKGQKATIKNIARKFYKLDIDNEIYFWTDEMLEPIAENTDENTDESIENTVETIDQFKKEDFKFGDIVTLRNGIQGLITIEEVQYNDDTFNIINDFNDDLTHITNDKNLDIIKVQRYIHYSQYGDTIYTLTTLYERKEEILTKEEKEYLSGVIRPFRDRIKAICKLGDTCAGEFICIDLSNENIKLPFFKQRTMYKGMELKKEYTLEELGL